MSSKKVIKVTEHSDSQHGWMAVKRKTVQEIIGLNNVSCYSYQKGNTVYLEEDRDLTNFINAIREKGIELERRIAKHYESSPIRNYQPFHLLEGES
jgi:hypothetical protein